MSNGTVVAKGGETVGGKRGYAACDAAGSDARGFANAAGPKLKAAGAAALPLLAKQPAEEQPASTSAALSCSSLCGMAAWPELSRSASYAANGPPRNALKQFVAWARSRSARRMSWSKHRTRRRASF